MSEESAVKVCVRVRPLIQREKSEFQEAEEAVPLYWKTDKHAVCQVDGTKSFNFDRVFNTEETTDKLYQEVARPLVVSAVNGYNGTIFAYGQTSSGKTFTMMGNQSSLGVIPLAIQDIFKIIEATPNREFLLRVSYMEVYNETVTDLLCDSRKKKPLEIREDVNRTVYVADLSEEVVTTAKMVMEWIKKGEKNRHYGETKMNERSSRSHTIFRMILESRESESSDGENVDGAVMVSHLNLVDLAGSERASQTGAAGLRLKEGCNINRSLFIIGQVIKKLSDGHAGGFINYRDSKLTRILQNSLGGNAKTVIICTITPAAIEETVSTLQFASTAKHMKNDPHVNEVLDDKALMKRYQNEIMDLKKRLQETLIQATEKNELAQLLLEKEQFQREQEDKIKNLTNMIITSDFSKKELKIKNKRRVTWAPGKLHESLRSSGGFKLDGLPMSASAVKRMKCAKSLVEFDISDCTEIEDAWSHTLDDPFELDASRSNVPVRRSKNAYSTLLEESPIFDGQENACDLESHQMDDMGAKIAYLEQQLQSERNEKLEVTEMRSFLEKRVSELEQQLQSQTGEGKESEHEEVKRVLEERIADMEQLLLENQTKELEQEYIRKGLEDKILELEQQYSTSKEEYTENKEALEKRIMELVHCLHVQENQDKDNFQDSDQLCQKDLLETIQFCEALEGEKEKLLSEMDVLRDACDNMTLENEGLRNEKKELQFKLKEKNEIEEFEALEKEIRREHEADLIHEITNLKKGAENAEACIQDLKDELSKGKALIADLQTSVDKDLVEQINQLRHSLGDAEIVTRDTKKESAILRSENLEMKEKMDEMTVKYQQMEKDVLTLRSQLEAEKLRYKNMQIDLQKELQQAFNENTKLTTLLDGKVPKDLIERIELERMVADLKQGLKQTLADKTALKEEVDASSALQHLPEKVGRLMKQVCELSNELRIVTSEREDLTLTIAERDSRIQELTEAAKQASEKLSENISKLNDAEMKVVNLTQQLGEVQQLLQSTQNCEQIKAESDSLMADKDQLRNELEELKIQLTTVSDELQQKHVEVSVLQSEREALTESQIELEGLRTQFERMELEAAEQGNKLQQLHREMEALNQEKDCLQQVLETVQSERDALTNVQRDLEKTMTDLCNTREELNQTQQLVGGLKNQIEEKEAQLASMEERLVERKLSECVEVSVDTSHYSNLFAEKEELLQSQHRLTVEVDRLQKELSTSTSRLEGMERDALEQTCRLQHLQEEMAETTQARDELFQKLAVMQVNPETAALTQELRLAKEELSRHQQLVMDLGNQLVQKDQDLTTDKKNMGETPEELQKKENQVTEELKMVTSERDILLAERRDTALSSKTDLQLGELQEQILSLVKERDELQEILEGVRTEKNELKANLQENIELSFGVQEQLIVSQQELEQQQRLVNELKSQIAKKELQLSNIEEKVTEIKEAVGLDDKVLQLTEALLRDHLIDERAMVSNMAQQSEPELHLGELQEQISSLTKERDELQEILESVRAEKNQLQADLQENIEMAIDTQEELRQHQQQITDLKKQIAVREYQVLSSEENLNGIKELQEKLNQMTEELKLVTIERDHLLAERRQSASGSEYELQTGELQKQIAALIKERDGLQQILESVRAEKSQLKADLQENVEMTNQVMEELKLVTSEQYHLAKRRDNDQGLETEQLGELQEHISSLTKERDELQEILESIRAEKSQLKADLQERVEMVNQLTEELTLVTKELNHIVAEKRDGAQGLESELQLAELQEQISSLAKERDELQEILEGVKSEKNQNIELTSKNQDEPRSALEELSQQQQLVRDLQTQTAQRESELQEKVNQVTYELKLVTSERDHLLAERDAAELGDLQEQISSLIKERNELQEILESVRAEKNQMKDDMQENIEMTIETQEKLRQQQQLNIDLKNQIAVRESELLEKSETQLKHQQQVVDEFKRQVAENEAQISSLQHKLAEESESQEILRQTQEELMHRRQEVEQLRCQVAEKEAWLSNLQETQADKLLSFTEELKLSAANQSHLMAENLSLVQSQESLNKELEELRNSVSRLEKIELEALEHEKKLSQFQGDMAALTQERDELQKTLDHLQVTMNVEKRNIESCLSEEKKENQRLLAKIAGFEEQVASMGSKSNPSIGEMEKLSLHLEGTDKQLKGCLQSFHKLKDQFGSWCSNMETILLKDIDSQKEFMSHLLSPLSSGQTKPVEILHCDIQRMSSQFKFVLKKLKVLYTTLAQNQMEHHQLTARYEMDCFEENKKQELLVKKIQFLTGDGFIKYNDQCETDRLSGLLEKRDLQLQEISQILSEMEHDFVKTDTEVQKEMQDREKMKEKLMALENPSVPDVMEILRQEKARIKQHVELMSQDLKSLALKFTDFDKKRKAFRIQSNKQLEEEKKKSQTLIQQLDSLTNVVPKSGAALLLQEENQRLMDKLGANEKEIEQMQLKIKELQGALDIAEENALEHRRKTSALQGELKDLEAKLTERENAIKSLNMNLVHIEAKVKKGAAPYTEELERLKTKVVKLEFERTGLSRKWQQEFDSLKAHLEHKEDSLRSLREKLRRMQQDHDETMHEDHKNHHPTDAGPLSCGSFGIVQSTAVLVIKAEKAKLEAEVHQLKKKNDELDSIVLNLQDEVSKWKARARKHKDSKAVHSLTDIERHSKCLPLSPLKQEVSVPQTPSPCRKLASSEILVLNSPKSKFFDSRPDSMSVSRPTQFFDNSSLGTVPGLESTKEAASETQDWWASAPRKNDTVSQCQTQ
ncbi:centromere-associated protein E isoform X2 [Polyodon spathula]|uniref:centromere-associated protein E isoform X2 n=1 Tax=Polyodon spathula TaxID=7913 RepID=UPI001B7F4C37|nr:centromere-associated protein E isoform X2 [Polyodon spathula]